LREKGDDYEVDDDDDDDDNDDVPKTRRKTHDGNDGRTLR
jgi:hypothetical protein